MINWHKMGFGALPPEVIALVGGPMDGTPACVLAMGEDKVCTEFLIPGTSDEGFVAHRYVRSEGEQENGASVFRYQGWEVIPCD